jgi:hypothetical protein
MQKRPADGEAGIDVLLATSKHNAVPARWLQIHLFGHGCDRASRYLPIVIYEKGRPDHTGYVANKMEAGEHANNPFWTPTIYPAVWFVDARELPSSI